MDPYLLLEVPHIVTIDDIRKGYRKLAKQWHPDKNGDSLGAAEMFRKIKAVYDCLVDPTKREAENVERKHREQTEAAKKAKAETQRQARAYTQPPPSNEGTSPWAAALVLIVLILVVAALFDSSNGSSGSTTA